MTEIHMMMMVVCFSSIDHFHKYHNSEILTGVDKVCFCILYKECQINRTIMKRI